MIDFGFACIIGRFCELKLCGGTPLYTAPEMICAGRKKQRGYAQPSDMWAAGNILFAMIFEFPPFIIDFGAYPELMERRDAIYENIMKGFLSKVREVEKYGYGRWFPDDMYSSEWVRNLIHGLLQTDTARRMTAGEVLLHPWIISNGSMECSDTPLSLVSASPPPSSPFSAASASASTPMSIAASPISLSRLTDDSLCRKYKSSIWYNHGKALIIPLLKYKRDDVLRDAVILILADQFKKMRRHHVHVLQQAFDEIDADSDGFITLYDLLTAFDKGMLHINATPCIFDCIVFVCACSWSV